MHLKFRNGIEEDNLPKKVLWKAWCSAQIQVFFFFFTGNLFGGSYSLHHLGFHFTSCRRCGFSSVSREHANESSAIELLYKQSSKLACMAAKRAVNCIFNYHLHLGKVFIAS